MPDAELAACGGPLDPPCPPDPSPCEFPDETACVVTDDGFSGVVVTAPGRISFWVEKLATRGDLADPGYVRLDALDTVGSLDVEVRGADGVRRTETLDVAAALALSNEGAAFNPDDGTPDWTRRYDQAEGGAPRFETGVLAPGDTVSLTYAMRVPGNRVPQYDSPGAAQNGGSPTHLFWSGDREVMALFVFEPGPGGTVANFLDTPYPAPYVQLFGRFEREGGLTVAPDTLFVGGTAELSLASDLPPETAVTLTVSDPAAGLLVGGVPPAARGAAPLGKVSPDGGQASLTTTLAGLADVQFVAANDLNAPAFTTVTAMAGGESFPANVAVYPQPVVRFIRQNTAPIPSSGPDAYLMVSKVRPDWLLPESDQSFQGQWGNVPFENETPQPTAPSLDTYHDRDTYRIEVSGLPPSLAERRLRFRLDLDGEPIWADGVEGQNALATVDYEAACNGLTPEMTCRTKRYLRLVSNARPAEGSITAAGAYDDEKAGTMTLRVELGDQVDASAFLAGAADGDPERELTPGGVALPVGQPAGGSTDDAVQQAIVMWHVFLRDNLATQAAPDVITDRMSEDWAQASIQFQQAAPARGVTADGLLNTLVLTVPRRLHADETGTVSGEAWRGSDVYPFSVSFGPQSPTALAIASQIDAQVTAAGGPEVTAFFLKGDDFAAAEVALVFDDARASITSSDLNLVRTGRHSPLFKLEKIDDGDDTEAVLAFARAVHDPANQATVGGTSVDVVNVFVAPVGAVRAASTSKAAAGLGTGDENSRSPNTLLLIEDAADVRDNLAVAAGHEAGHVLLVEDFAGSGGSDHHPLSYNLMDASVEVNPNALSLRFAGKESLDASKRLTRGQQASARCESGTGSSTNLCLPNEPQGPSRLLSAPGVPSFAPTPSLQAPPSESRAAAAPSQ